MPELDDQQSSCAASFAGIPAQSTCANATDARILRFDATRRGEVSAVTTVTDEPAMRAEVLGRHDFESAESAVGVGHWTETRRRASGRDMCTCGLPRRNWRHKPRGTRRQLVDAEVVEFDLGRRRRDR